MSVAMEGRRSPGRRLALLVPLVGLVLATMAGPASAVPPGGTGTVSVSGSQLIYTANTGVANSLVFDFLSGVSEGRILIFDGAGRPNPGANCFNDSDPKTVMCLAEGVTTANISLGDRDDSARAVDGGFLSSITISGGTGDDHISSQLQGPGPTPAHYFGNDGNDTLDGGDGGDVLDGGNGQDSLTGDGLAPGQPQGNDTLIGGADFDTLYGMGGNDTLDGGATMDFYDAGTGNDTVNAQLDNTADLSVECGSGTDTARRDSQDIAAAVPFAHCETLIP